MALPRRVIPLQDYRNNPHSKEAIMSETTMDDGILNTTKEPEPTAAASTGKFRIHISLQGVPLGWWKDVGSPQWWIVATGNMSEAIVWEQVPTGGHIYLKKSTNNYLSYRDNAPSRYGLKIRDWLQAGKWALQGSHLLCVNNGKLVGINDGSFYCN